MDSIVDNTNETINSFNKRFQLNESERKAVEWAVPYESGNPETMFNIINTYTRAAQFTGLSASSRYRLEKTGGSILNMVNSN